MEWPIINPALPWRGGFHHSAAGTNNLHHNAGKKTKKKELKKHRWKPSQRFYCLVEEANWPKLDRNRGALTAPSLCGLCYVCLSVCLPPSPSLLLYMSALSGPSNCNSMQLLWRIQNMEGAARQTINKLGSGSQPSPLSVSYPHTLTLTHRCTCIHTQSVQAWR